MERKEKYEGVSINDMIFEHRNKAYGAYAIRTTENDRIKYALIYLAGFLFIVGYMPKLLGMIGESSAESKYEIIAKPSEIGEIIPDPIEEIIIPKADKPIPQATTAANTEYRVVSNDQQAQDTLIENNKLAFAETTGKNQEGGSTTGCIDCVPKVNDPPAPLPKPAVKEVPSAPLNIAEVMPEYIGGEKAMMRFIASNIHFPDYELDNTIEGKTYIRFVVNEDGSVSEVEVARSGGKNFDKEGMRVVKMLGKFKPGMQSGINVKVRMVLPIVFKVN